MSVLLAAHRKALKRCSTHRLQGIEVICASLVKSGLPTAPRRDRAGVGHFNRDATIATHQSNCGYIGHSCRHRSIGQIAPTHKNYRAGFESTVGARRLCVVKEQRAPLPANLHHPLLDERFDHTGQRNPDAEAHAVDEGPRVPSGVGRRRERRHVNANQRASRLSLSTEGRHDPARCRRREPALSDSPPISCTISHIGLRQPEPHADAREAAVGCRVYLICVLVQQQPPTVQRLHELFSIEDFQGNLDWAGQHLRLRSKQRICTVECP